MIVILTTMLAIVGYEAAISTGVQPCEPYYGPSAPGALPNCASMAFGQLSPFYQRVPAKRTLLSNSDAAVKFYMHYYGNPGTFGYLNAGIAGRFDYYHPIYYSRPNDPLLTVTCTRYGGNCDLGGHQIRVPSVAQPAGGTDHHIGIIDQENAKEYDCWGAQISGNALTANWCKTFSLDGPGLTAPGSIGPTAAGFALSLGSIRVQEIEAGVIPHALFLVLGCTSGAYVYPASSYDAPCAINGSGYNGSNAVPMGARMHLNMTDAQIAALPVLPWKKVVLTALAHYGAFFGDTGAVHGPAFQLDSPLSYTSFGNADPQIAFARSVGIPYIMDRYRIDFNTPGVDLQPYLEFLDPCVTQQTC